MTGTAWRAEAAALDGDRDGGAVRLTVRDGVARVVLDRGRRANALDAATVEALHEAFVAADDSGARVVVLQARGRAFCGGLDLSGLEAETDATLLQRLVRVQMLLERVDSLRALSVAVVEGDAVGAGADLVLACAVRLALPGASLRFPGSGFGAVLGVARLAALTSPSFAAEVGLTARRLDRAEADGHGLWHAVADHDTLDTELERLVTCTSTLPYDTVRQVRAAARSSGPDPLGCLVRSLAEPGLAERIGSYRSRSSLPTTRPGVSP